MANIEGIIFADLFINSKDQFIEFFTQHYSQNQKIIDSCINDLSNVLTLYSTKAITPVMAQEFKTSWNNFEKNVLLNQNDLQLLVSYRGSS